eukprot:1157342-Pelagomonas_calceolata.AAC.7
MQPHPIEDLDQEDPALSTDAHCKVCPCSQGYPPCHPALCSKPNKRWHCVPGESALSGMLQIPLAPRAVQCSSKRQRIKAYTICAAIRFTGCRGGHATLKSLPGAAAPKEKKWQKLGITLPRYGTSIYCTQSDLSATTTLHVPSSVTPQKVF